MYGSLISVSVYVLAYMCVVFIAFWFSHLLGVYCRLLSRR
jgi:hypothetical protein